MNTIKTVNGWTKAKLLELISKRPNYRCVAEKPTDSGDYPCMYLDSNGGACAIGMFIPSGHEGQQHLGSVSSLLDHYRDLFKLMPFDSIDDLSLFQSVHDRCDLGDVNLALTEWIKYNVEDDA